MTSLRTSSRHRRRGLADRFATGAIISCLAVALIPLAMILAIVVKQGISSTNLSFLTQTSISLADKGGGWLHGLIGSLYMLLIATLIAAPVGIAAALYLVEYANERLTLPVRFFADVMTGVPSIFVGLFIYAALVGMIGFGTFVGALSLALLMLPIIVRSSEEVLRLVPNELRRAAYALGARRWQAAVKV